MASKAQLDAKLATQETKRSLAEIQVEEEEAAQPKNKVQTVKKTQDQQRKQQANEQSQQPPEKIRSWHLHERV